MQKSFFLIVFLLFFPLSLPAQSIPDNEADSAFMPSQINKTLDTITNRLNKGNTNKEQINEISQTLNQIQSTLSQIRLSYNTKQEAIQKKINTLGPLPDKDQEEPAPIATQRQNFNQEADQTKATIIQIDLLLAKIDELNNLILKKRNQQLLNNILVKQSSIFHPQEFSQSLSVFSQFVVELLTSPLQWYQQLNHLQKTEVNKNLFSILAGIISALIIAYGISRYISHWFGYKKTIEHPHYSQKVRAGIWVFIAQGVIPATTIGAFILWLKNCAIINLSSFGTLLNSAAIYLLYYYLIKAAVKTIFTPHNGKWRIIEVDNDRANAICSSLIFAAAAICFISFLLELSDLIKNDISITYSLKIISNAVKAFCIIWISYKALYDTKTLTDADLTEEASISDLSTSSKISLLVTFTITLAFLLSFLGYIRLSEYIINRFIFSGISIGIIYITDKLIRTAIHRLLLLRFWIRTFRIHRRALVKTEFWLGLTLTPIMWLLAFLILLAVWGVPVDLLLARSKSFLVGFNIGGVRISISSILLGIFCFFVALSFSKMLKNSFIKGKLSNIEMEDGIRNSIVSSINFLGFIFSALLAIAVMGGSLSSIAIIAGALSFGVGLGLQNMVGNLAAGLTILWERPIKIGDWIVINDLEGIVKKINIRSTELETWDKSVVIIPNASILSQSLINYTYTGKTGRVVIKVNVGYDSDIALIRQTLLEIALSNSEVLKNPAPYVLFNNLGDSSLEFQLNCYTANVFNRSLISNDLREKIINRFRDLAINIPTQKQIFYLEDLSKK